MSASSSLRVRLCETPNLVGCMGSPIAPSGVSPPPCGEGRGWGSGDAAQQCPTARPPPPTPPPKGGGGGAGSERERGEQGKGVWHPPGGKLSAPPQMDAPRKRGPH